MADPPYEAEHRLMEEAQVQDSKCITTLLSCVQLTAGNSHIDSLYTVDIY